MPAKVTIQLHVLENVLQSELLNIYSRWFKESSSRQAYREQLWICPSQDACRNLQLEFTQIHQQEVVSPWFMTFDDFANKLLTSSSQNVFPLSPFEQKLLIREVVEQLKKAEKIQSVTKLIQNSSFIDYITRFITDMKRDEIWPETLQKLYQKIKVTPADLDLNSIYEDYQQELIKTEHYDAQGRFWSARELLENGFRGPFSQVSKLVIHGFHDFTASQKSILGNLASWLQEINISLAVEFPVERSLLFSKVNSTIKVLQNIFKSAESELKINQIKHESLSPDQNVPAGLKQIRKNLFAVPSRFSTSANTEGLSILAVSGYQSESLIILAKIKELLAKQVYPEEIIVVFRQQDEKSLEFARLAEKSGIPVSYDHYVSLAHTPVGQALKTFLQLEQDDWSYSSIINFVSNSFFYPHNTNENTSPQLFVEKLRQLNLPVKKDEILNALNRHLEFELSKQPENSNLQNLQLYIKKLSGLTDQFRNKHTFEAWVDLLIPKFDSLWIKSPDHPNYELDKKHWDQIAGILKDAVLLQRRLSHHAHKLSFTEFMTRLDELLQTQTPGKFLPTRTPGTIRILTADAARHFSTDYAFLMNLTQDQYAAKARRNDWEEIKSKVENYQQKSLEDILSEEQLLFFSIISRTRKHLYLSYPATNSSGEPLSPSPCVISLLTLFNQSAKLIEEVGELDPVANSSLQLNSTARRIYAAKELTAGKAGYFKTLLHNVNHREQAMNQVHALQLLKFRLHTEGLTHYEGELSYQENNKQHMRMLFPEKYQFSATQLESYLYCYYRFMVEQIMKIQPLNEPGLTVPSNRHGNIIHDVFAEYHQQGRVDSHSLAERLKQILSLRLKREVSWNELQKALLEVEQNLLDRWCELHEKQDQNYHGALDKFQQKPDTIHSEIAFGSALPLENLSTPDADQPVKPPVKFGTDTQPVYLRGRIDRIDQGVIDGQQVYNIVDYKSGNPSTFGNNLKNKSGYQLQLAMYAIAAVRMGIIPRIENIYQIGYWKIKGKGYTSGISRAKVSSQLNSETVKQLESELNRLLPLIVQSIRDGHFPVYNPNLDCSSYCNFRTICRINELRSRADKLHKTFIIDPETELVNDEDQDDDA